MYYAELYTPPASAPTGTSTHLFIFKTQNGRTELLAHVEHESLTLALPIAALAGSIWRDVNYDELPELAYCTCTDELDAGSIHFFQLQADGTLIQLPPIDDIGLGIIVMGYKLYGLAEIEWGRDTYRAAIYGPPRFEGYRYNYVRVYKEASGEIVGLVEKGGLDPRWHEFAEYTLQGDEISSWHDINGDGMPELVLAANQIVTGVCEKHEISIMQIRPDGKVVDLPTGYCVWDVDDVNDDGLLELVHGTRYSSAFGCVIHTACWTSDIFAWDGQAYVKADATQFAGYYQSRIEKAIDQAETIAKGNEPLDSRDLELLELIIVAHKLADREAEGLILLDHYTDPARYEGRLSETILSDLHKLREFYGLPPTSSGAMLPVLARVDPSQDGAAGYWGYGS